MSIGFYFLGILPEFIVTWIRNFHLIVVLAIYLAVKTLLLYPDSGIPMDEEIGLGDMIWSYNKVEL